MARYEDQQLMTEQVHPQAELDGSSTPSPRRDGHSKVCLAAGQHRILTHHRLAATSTPHASTLLVLTTLLNYFTTLTTHTYAGAAQGRVQHLQQQPCAAQPGTPLAGSQAQGSL